MSDLSLVDVQKQTTDVKYVVAMDCDETSIVVYQEEEPHWTVTVNLTCPAIRQQTDEGLSATLSYYTNVSDESNHSTHVDDMSVCICVLKEMQRMSTLKTCWIVRNVWMLSLLSGVSSGFTYVSLLSRRSQQRERLHATGLSISSSVCLSVCLSVGKIQKRVAQKHKQFTAMVSVDNL